MIIANPIYDVVFKRLMEDKKIAKFFIETLTSETIIDIEVKPQEFTFFKELEHAQTEAEVEAIKDQMRQLVGLSLSIYRLDFIATIKTETGEHKKVLIEIQKAKNAVDLMRFRNYLAEQYKKEDEIRTAAGIIKTPLPIITLYLLGFPLSEIETSIVKVNRQYLDLITNEIIHRKSDFVEKLTHDCYVVQIPRIQPRVQSKIEALLSIFEQSNFADDKEITKNYNHKVTSDIIQRIIAILHHAGTDPLERSEIEKEQEALRVFENSMRQLRQTIAEKDKALSEKEKVIEENEKALKERDQTISAKDQALADQAKVIEELLRKLNEK